MSQPRTPISPPLLPTSTLPFTTSGAIVIVSPLLMSPSFVCHSSLPVAGVERDRVVVERVEEDLAVGVGDAAVDDVAARDPLRRELGLRNVGPFQLAGRGIERKHLVRIRRSIGPDHIQCVVDDERRCFLSAIHADREGPGERSSPTLLVLIWSSALYRVLS